MRGGGAWVEKEGGLGNGPVATRLEQWAGLERVPECCEYNTTLANLLLLILQYNEYANNHVLYNYRLYTKRRSIFHLLHYTVMLCPAQHIGSMEINGINQ